MITIFNRKELLITFDINEQSKVKDILAANNIDYYTKVINQYTPYLSASRLHLNSKSPVQMLNYEYEHIIYVHKKDYEKAVYLIKKD